MGDDVQFAPSFIGICCSGSSSGSSSSTSSIVVRPFVHTSSTRISRISARAGELPVMSPHSNYINDPTSQQPSMPLARVRVAVRVTVPGRGGMVAADSRSRKQSHHRQKIIYSQSSGKNRTSLKQHHFMPAQLRKFVCAGRYTPAGQLVLMYHIFYHP